MLPAPLSTPRRRWVALIAALLAVAGISFAAVPAFAASAPVITGPATATATVGTAFSVTPTYTSASPSTTTIKLTAASDSLPSGLSIDDSTAGVGAGKIHGTPGNNTGGVYHLILRADDTAKKSDPFTLTLTVNESPNINGANTATATVGQSFTWTPTKLGGFPAPTVTLNPGAGFTDLLPTGVTLNFSTGVLSGTPAAGTGGVYLVRLDAQNSTGPDNFVKITLTVNEASGITGDDTATGQVNQPFSYTPTVSQGFPPPATVTLDSGTLPPGTTLNSTTGTISGTPTQHGTYVVTLKATNTTGSGTLTVTITIANGDITGLDPTITGLEQVGQTLTAHTGTVLPDDSTFTYVWKADGTVIPGATGSTLLLTPSMAGQHIKVKITASHPEYNDVSATSDETTYIRELVKKPKVTLGDATACDGQTVHVLGQGLKPGKTYTITAFNQTITKVADQYGEVKASFQVPNDIPVGTDRSVALNGPGTSVSALLTVTCGLPI